MNHSKLRTIAPAGVKLVEGYPVPAGGAGEEGGGSSGDGDGTDGGDGTEGEGGDAGDGEGGDGDAGDGDGGDAGRAGGEDALKRDLARERRKRQTAEREARELREAQESDAERREREAREQALTPARAMVRRSAIRVAAQEVGFVDPSDAVAAMIADGSIDDLEVDDDRAELADEAAVKDALEALGKRKPHLLTEDAAARLTGAKGTRSGGSDTRDGQGSGNGDRGKGDPLASFGNAIRTRAGRR